MKKGRIKPGIVVAGLTAIGSIFGLILDVVCGRYEEKMMKEEIDAAVDKKVNETNATIDKKVHEISVYLGLDEEDKTAKTD